METLSNTVLKSNLFHEDKIATGESFFGRKDILTNLEKTWIESEGSGNRSLIGLNRMGKSSIGARFVEIVQKHDPNAICIMLTLGNSSWPLLLSIIVETIIVKEMSADEVVIKICNDIKELDTEYGGQMISNRATQKFIQLLDRFKKIGQKFLLVIDEFDGAKHCWKDHGYFFEDLRDTVSKNDGFFLLISRKPLECIEADSYGNSCFHNVFPEINVGAFDPVKDMPEFYAILEKEYDIHLDDMQMQKIEDNTGLCPVIVAGIGNRLASSAIWGEPIPDVDEIFGNHEFRNNYLRHYEGFLTRMQEDGLWDTVVRVIMDINVVDPDQCIDRQLRKDEIDTLFCKGYLRNSSNSDTPVVISDDFTSWAKHKLIGKEVDTIYQYIIAAEVDIREILRKEMVKIWNELYEGRNWERDFLDNAYTVPKSVVFFTRSDNGKRSDLCRYYNNAKKYNPYATVVDALTISVKLALVEEYWDKGISKYFGQDKYEDWEHSFKIVKEIRNPVFHAQITAGTMVTSNYYLLKEANEHSIRISNAIRNSISR